MKQWYMCVNIISLELFSVAHEWLPRGKLSMFPYFETTALFVFWKIFFIFQGIHFPKSSYFLANKPGLNVIFITYTWPKEEFVFFLPKINGLRYLKLRTINVVSSNYNFKKIQQKSIQLFKVYLKWQNKTKISKLVHILFKDLKIQI